MRLPAFELRRRLYIIFRGEEGLDYGGVARYMRVRIYNIQQFHVYTKLLKQAFNIVIYIL